MNKYPPAWKTNNLFVVFVTLVAIAVQTHRLHSVGIQMPILWISNIRVMF